MEKPEIKFDDVIGQVAAKAKLGFYAGGHNIEGWSPNILLTGPKGMGKTHTAISFAKKLTKPIGEDGALKFKRIEIINCVTLRTVNRFAQWYQNSIQGKYNTVIFDEASEIPKEIQMLFLSMFAPNVVNMVTVGDVLLEVDLKQQSFVFCTSEPQKVFRALVDRLRRIDLAEYTVSEFAEIIKKNLKNVAATDEALMEAVSICRGNARKAKETADDIGLYCSQIQRETFGIEEFKGFTTDLGIFPLGLRPMEILVLQSLRQGEKTLTSLCAITGLSPSSTRMDYEEYLQKMGLMVVGDGRCRFITQAGLEYLRNVGM